MLTSARVILVVAVAGHWLLELVGCRSLQEQGNAGQFLASVTVHAVATLAYVVLCVAVVRGSYRPRFIEALALAVLLRLLVLPLQPALSDDIHRYLHEGNMVLQGENPFLTPPADVPDHLRLPDWERINHKEVPAAYPPGVQYLLAAGYATHPSPLGMKIVFGVCDLLVFVVLWLWLPAIGLAGCRAIVYGFCPLMVLEFAGEGHGDSLAVLWLVLALWAFGRGRRHLSSGCLAVATAAKLMPIALLPFVARRAWSTVLTFCIVLVALYLPFVLDASILGGKRSMLELFAGTGRYADAWNHNDSIFDLLQRASRWGLELANDIAGKTLDISYYPHRVAKVPIVLLAGVLLVWAFVRRWPLHKVMAGVFTLFVSCTPTLHPWYLAFLVPFLCVYPTVGWLLFTGTIYLAHAIPAFELTTFLKILEYVPFYFGFFAILRDRSPGSATDRGDEPSRGSRGSLPRR